MPDFDVCIIGSGAGGGPVAYALSMAGYKVLVLEKGPWFKTEDFSKDELACCRRSVYTPNLRDEAHVIEEESDGEWQAESTFKSGWDFWNGNMVGGSSNLMSGFFHRLKPVDFRLLSEFGPIAGANITDWPITYDDLEPYYTRVEQIVGVSGKVVAHRFLEPRSTADFPYPPLLENTVCSEIDQACQTLGYQVFPTPRAILSRPEGNRRSCYYSDFCGSYGCSSDAKSSSRVALLDKALATGNCEIRPNAKVFHLGSDSSGKVTAAHYYDAAGQRQTVDARIFVVACQAIETSRLLLNSTGPKYPRGLANGSGQVGKNLLFSGGGSGQGTLFYKDFPANTAEALRQPGVFVNRALQDWYEIYDPSFGERAKGGTIDFLWKHSNAISRANSLKWDEDDQLIWGKKLKRKLETHFNEARYLRFEIFNDWLPNDNCFVSLDPNEKDKWGDPQARFRIGYHRHDLKVGQFLAEKAENVLRQMGAEDIYSSISGSPSANLQAGGCRFGHNPETSVLDADCRSHEAENLYITDGSFMPTGGSVTYTFTIYANAFRVADKIIAAL